MADRRVEIKFNPHPTDSLLVCEECQESLASADIKELADFVEAHQRRHSDEM